MTLDSTAESRWHRAEWGKTPRRWRRYTPSPGEAGGRRYVPRKKYFNAKVKSHFFTPQKSLLLRDMLRDYFISEYYFAMNWLHGIDYLIKYLVFFCFFVSYSSTSMTMHFATFPCMLVLFCYANEVSGRRLGERCHFVSMGPLVRWGKTAFGSIFGSCVSQYRVAVFPQQSGTAKE